MILRKRSIGSTRTETFGTKDTDSDIAYELNENTTSNGTLIAPNTDALWDSTFIDLRQSNMIIEKSQTYEGDPSEIERYVAEARFFRAYSHFRLMAKYNDIPILTKVLTVDSRSCMVLGISNRRWKTSSCRNSTRCMLNYPCKVS